MNRIILFACILAYYTFGTHAQDLTQNSAAESVTGTNITHHVTKSRLDSENHKPMFSDCNTRKSSVEEEANRGTFVSKIQATDPDPPGKKGGNIKYEIVQRPGERVNFIINETTGEIYTNAVFDRDEPARQKELYITVQATDDGIPPLADICVFKITITDINDCSPIFDQQDYKAKVSVDQKQNSEVMRIFAYDYDEGENSRLTYEFPNPSQEFKTYFRIDPATGVVYQNQELPNNFVGKQFTSTVLVHDNGVKVQNKVTAEVSITIVGSDKRQPEILRYPKEITVKEDLNDFDTPLLTIEADSRVNDDPTVVFELITGKTAQTNHEQTFILTPGLKENIAEIRLARHLDYETVTEYQLSVRVQNKDQLASSVNIIIKVEDVNDEIPTFMELLRGSVVENDRPGVQAMTVQAFDKDGTAPFNVVKYKLMTDTDLFQIDENSGVISSKKEFDREQNSVYYVTVNAYDGAPSAILRDKTKPNSVNQTFPIFIEDANDNPPHFPNSIYIVQNVSETADRLKDVIEVKAEDQDSAAVISYSIIEGNIDNAFVIESTTGRIKVNAELDYEKIKSYNLTIKADDGAFSDTTKVIIHIQNENDENPVFETYTKEITIVEESTPSGCLITLTAYDPDIEDRNADQRIVYRIAKQHRDFLSVEQNGCVRLIKPLDRDPPNGAPQYQGFIYAYDNAGGPNALNTYAEIIIILEDINDNAPFLKVTEVVWYENEEPGIITTLTAIDYDTDKNGPPFKFKMADSQSEEAITTKFSVDGDKLQASVMFDREAKKYYDVKISITDSGIPTKTGISTIRVIIGDRNDNEAQDGSSEIFVYKYEDLSTDIEIGRVYVDDPDDWDLDDKVFQFAEYGNEFFSLNPGGMIVMKNQAIPNKYVLNFVVTEEHLPLIPKHTVNAVVNITVQELPAEAVHKSGSMRFKGRTVEEFIEKDLNGVNKKDLLQKHISSILNTQLQNVDVFTVMPFNSSFIDVRFSAHGSPYYPPEKLNKKVAEVQEELERELGIEFLMININECLLDNNCTGTACRNNLEIYEVPAVVFTNKTSFVGVKAVTSAICDCNYPVSNIECSNGGTHNDANGVCQCPAGYDGPKCEIPVSTIGFNGNGWAMYPSLDSCNHTTISISFRAQSQKGLVFYAGPLSANHAKLSKEFIALELQDRNITLKLELGFGVQQLVLENSKSINDGAVHEIRIIFTTDDMHLELVNCPQLCKKSLSFQQSGLLRTNGPVLVGGLTNLLSAEAAKGIWNNPPVFTGFSGCIANLTYNGKPYDLGSPSDSLNAKNDCNYGIAQGFIGINSNFLIAILVCIAILIIMLLAMFVHRRKGAQVYDSLPDGSNQNIINYEEEGGGETDAKYDASLFAVPIKEKQLDSQRLYRQAPESEADMSAFFDNRKGDLDDDLLANDDVRDYGFEGDGNSTVSLSSLGSGTDDEDLIFKNLSNLGPSFQKLADIYGDDSGEESQGSDEES